MENYKKYTREVIPDIEESLSKIVTKVDENSVVLDIGCSSGMLGRYLALKKACIVDGVDIDEKAVENCKPVYRKVAVKNLETDGLTDVFAAEAYDYIIVADVIEHLNSPDRLLEQLKLLLKPRGTIIFSVPNITHIASALELLLGNFEYRENGLLDNTHLRFYSYKNLVGKLMNSGLYVWESDAVRKDIDETEFGNTQSKLFPPHWLKALVTNRPDSLVYQWILSTRLYPCLDAPVEVQPASDKVVARPVFTSALYWACSVSAGFNETDKIIPLKVNESGKDTTLEFEFSLQSDQKIQKIRIDPISEAKVVWIKSARIVGAHDELLWQWDPAQSTNDVGGAKWVGAGATTGKVLLSDTDDPQWWPEIPVFTLLRVTSGAKLLMVICEDERAINTELIGTFVSRQAAFVQALAERERQVRELAEEGQQQRSAYHVHIAELESARARDIADLRAQLDALYASTSWKITGPMRRASSFTQRALGAAGRRIGKVKRALPVSVRARERIKNVVYPVFGFALGNVKSYQFWKEQRQRHTDWGMAAPIASTRAVPMTPFVAADGKWEWLDYAPVKKRIAEIKGTKRASLSPTPVTMIDIGTEPFSSVAAKVKLPQLVDTPDVSIIVPAFNHLKLTLECLLSISQHAEADVSFEVIVADDASTDETASVIGAIPNLRLIRNDRNVGFLLNCNNALRHVRGKYVLYLNNDVQVTAGWLRALLDTFKLYPNAGAVGPRFVYPSGHLQEAGVVFRPDGSAEMIGLNEDPSQPRFSYVRRVDYVSGACLMLPTELAKQLGGFSEEFLPCYCEDSDLCLSVRQAGYDVYYNPAATIVHHLSKTTSDGNNEFKMRCIAKNLVTLQNKWQPVLERSMMPKVIAFYLPQFHPFPENDKWWGKGFTEWTNVSKAQPNFVGHYQPRLPADLGYYDLRLSEVMEQQAQLARRYGVEGFCFYYYWFGGKRLLEQPIEQMLATGKPNLPFCLCWANENWTRRWDGQDHEVLMAQSHSPEDDEAVIKDLMRYFRDARYIRIDGRPLILVYRVTLFPDFAQTAARWRTICREEGLGEIYIAMVESFELVHAGSHPSQFGCDAAVEFPPLGMAEPKPPSGEVINPNFEGQVADYRDLAVRYATRDLPAYTRFRGVMPSWDNTARRQNNGFCFEHATPGAFQAWLEEAVEQTRAQQYGDERLVFINAWNEWAEGAYLEPDRRFGHTYLEAVKNALEASRLLRNQ